MRIRPNGLKSKEPFEFRSPLTKLLNVQWKEWHAHAIPIIAISFNHSPLKSLNHICTLMLWDERYTKSNTHTQTPNKACATHSIVLSLFHSFIHSLKAFIQFITFVWHSFAVQSLFWFVLFSSVRSAVEYSFIVVWRFKFSWPNFNYQKEYFITCQKKWIRSPNFRQSFRQKPVPANRLLVLQKPQQNKRFMTAS